jgi:DNA-binding beta-propeller fold protein YncE
VAGLVAHLNVNITGIDVPLGMDPGPDGLLYVFDVKPQVSVVDPDDGHIVRRWGRQGAGRGEFDVRRPDDNPGYGDIAVGPDGRVYVADGSNHRIQAFSPEGGFLFQFGSFGTGAGQFGFINEIAIARDGSVYVDDGRISKFNPDGKFVWRTDDGAVGLAVRSDGVLLGTCEAASRSCSSIPRMVASASEWTSPRSTATGSAS